MKFLVLSLPKKQWDSMKKGQNQQKCDSIGGNDKESEMPETVK